MHHLVYLPILLSTLLAVAIVGAAVCRLLRPATSLWFGGYRYRMGHQLVVGQLAIISYYYVRSFACRWGWRGVSGAELWILVGLALLACLVFHRHRLTGHYLANAWRRYWAIYIALPAVFVTVFCFTELPRDVMLSSDPDDHAAWAHIVAQAGAVPWQPEPLKYPAGFSSLNAVYMQLGGMRATTVVSIQPLLQWLICLLVMIESALASLAAEGRRRRRMTHPVTLFFVLLLVMTYLAYSFQKERYHHEGLGRLCTIAMLSFVFSFALAKIMGQVRVIGAGALLRLALVLRITVAILVLFNPASGMISAVIVEGLLLFCLLGRLGWKSVLGWAAAMLVYAGVFLDPYYALAGQGLGAGTDAPLDAPTGVSVDSAAVWRILKSTFLPIAECTWFRTDMFRSWGSQYFAMVCAVFLIAMRRTKPLLLSLGLALAAWAICNILVGVFALYVADRPGVLLLRYTRDNGQQFLYLFLVYMLGVTTMLVLSAKKRVPLFLALAVAVSPALFDRNTRNYFAKRRCKLASSMGDPTANDRLVVQRIREFGERADRASGRGKDRILVMANFTVINDVAEYLFSFGGARLLIYETPFPLAFYYHLGPPDFSLENYAAHVRDYLDIPWLVERGIHYIYIPEGTSYRHIAEPSLRGFPVRLIFQEGDCRFYEILWPPASSQNAAEPRETRQAIDLQWEAVQQLSIEDGPEGVVMTPAGQSPQAQVAIPERPADVTCTLELQLSSERMARLEWYYDFGSGYTSSAGALRQVAAGRSTLTIGVPRGMKRLRIDPICKTTIHHAELCTRPLLKEAGTR